MNRKHDCGSNFLTDLFSVQLEDDVVKITAVSVGPNFSNHSLINGNRIFSRISLIGVIVQFLIENMAVALIS